MSGQEARQGEKGTMKKTLLALGLAAATMPLTFAAQAPNAPAASNPAPATSTAKTKKHVKKVHKTKTEKADTTAAKPAPAPSK